MSRQRHHWLVRTRSTVASAARIAAPISRACSLPRPSRLRWVVQSSSMNCAESPVPGAWAWRTMATMPGWDRRANRVSAAVGASGERESLSGRWLEAGCAISRCGKRRSVVRAHTTSREPQGGGGAGRVPGAWSAGISPSRYVHAVDEPKGPDFVLEVTSASTRRGFIGRTSRDAHQANGREQRNRGTEPERGWVASGDRHRGGEHEAVRRRSPRTRRRARRRSRARPARAVPDARLRRGTPRTSRRCRPRRTRRPAPSQVSTRCPRTMRSGRTRRWP